MGLVMMPRDVGPRERRKQRDAKETVLFDLPTVDLLQ